MGTDEGGTPVEAESLPELRFEHALPGFPGLQRFVLVRLDDEPTAAPSLYELRSLDQPQVRFMVGAPAAFFPDYEVELDEEACAELGLDRAEDALVLVILTVGTDLASTTANLLAPIVVNVRTLVAGQMILTGSEWPVRAPLV